MKYALVNNIKSETKSGLKGVCTVCMQSVIPKCGNNRIHHWAHSRNSDCDSWWEPETPWHRNWKNKFPVEWQEHIFQDQQTGEKHIADVFAKNQLVIECQHSHISPVEIESRESFYKKMVWIVDGNRLKRDLKKFIKGKENFKIVDKGIFFLQYPEDYLPNSWLYNKVPVILDFRNSIDEENSDQKINLLYCIFPIRIQNKCIITEFSENAFIKSVLEDSWLSRSEKLINELKQVENESRIQEKILNKQRENYTINKLLNPNLRKQIRF